MKKNIFFAILLLGTFLRIYKLEHIPAELWGDVNEHMIYAKNILKGNLYFDFFGGDGPIFDYLTSITFFIFGGNFLTIKLTTVLIGILTIYFAYLIINKINKDETIKTVTLFLMATSFWLISFSRQAKPHILVLLFIEMFIYTFILKRYILSGIILGLGMFTQSSFWGMTLFSLIHPKTFLTYLPFFIVLFYFEIYPEFFIYSESFFSEKIGHTLSMHEKIYNFLENIVDNMKSIFFLFQGDHIFRHNIPNKPILDIVLSIFFIIGLIIFIKQTIYDIKKRNINFFLFLIFIFSQFPSFLDISHPIHSPSFGRMIGSAFIIYYVCAIGFAYIYKKLTMMTKRKIYIKIGIIIFLIYIVSYNAYNYFLIYPQTLPNQNTPYGKIISDDISKELKSSNDLSIIIFGCCWGDWGQPEQKSFINYLNLDFGNKNSIMYFDVSQERELYDHLNFLKTIKNNIIIYTKNDVEIFHHNPELIFEENKIFYKKVHLLYPRI